ncbi:ComEC/Rec2 family competence protein [Rubripirellula amarantea]|nr:ComEC/Rec2 family competence protein [Rubripirellula amarantea]
MDQGSAYQSESDKWDHPTDSETSSLREKWRRLAVQQPLLFLFIAAIVGVVWDAKVVEFRIGFWIITALCSAALIALPSSRSRLRSSYGEHKLSWLLSAAAMLMFGSLAIVDHRLQDWQYESASMLSIVGQQSSPHIVEGTLRDAPVLRIHPLEQQRIARDQSPWQTQLNLRVDSYRSGKKMQAIDGNIKITVDGQCDHYLPGDRIRVYGDLYSSGPATNPGGTDRYQSDRRLKTHARMNVDRVEQITLLESGQRSQLVSRSIAMLAGRGRDTLLTTLSESNGPLAVALVIGQRDFVDNPTRDLLLVTGTAHLLSVSGMHLAIVVTLANMIAMLLRFPLSVKVVFILLVCVFYTAITGARPPVMRAALLVTVFTVAIFARRPNQPINTLSLAGLVLLFCNPENVFSMGVQLSFLAVATLLFASGRMGSSTSSIAVKNAIDTDRQFEQLAESSRSAPRRWLRQGLRVVSALTWLSLCVSVISLPLVWHQFNVVSPISVVANVVLGPFLFAALAFGIATSLAGLIHPTLAMLPSMGCGLTISLMRWIIDACAAIPLGHAWLPAPPGYWVVTFYVGIAATMVMPARWNLPRSVARTARLRGCQTKWLRYSWIGVWLFVAASMVSRPTLLPKETIEATFVDVGHGTCVIIRVENEVWLYDCGRLGNEQGSSRGIDQALWSMNVNKLDGVIISHADSDHFNALPGIARRFQVNQVVTPPGMLAEPEQALDRIRDAIAEHDIEVREFAAGELMSVGNRKMQILHPPRPRIQGSDNANSLVLQLDHGGKSMILPGDLEPPGTEMLINQDRPLPGGVLMAPHHGSLRMDAEVVLQWARPANTIVSGGRLARRPEVEAMLHQFGSQVDVTSVVGAVRVRIDGDGQIEIRKWLITPW